MIWYSITLALCSFCIPSLDFTGVVSWIKKSTAWKTRWPGGNDKNTSSETALPSKVMKVEPKNQLLLLQESQCLKITQKVSF